MRTRWELALAGAGAAALLAVAALPRGREALTVLLVATQVGLAAAWCLLLRLPRPAWAAGLAAAVAAAGDGVLLAEGGTRIGGLAGPLGVGTLAAMVLELGRRNRSGTADRVAGTVTACLLVLATAAVLALHAGRIGRDACVLAFVATGGALLVVRLLLARSGWLRVAGGLAAGAALGALVGSRVAGLGPARGVGLGVAVAAAATVAALAVDAFCTARAVSPGAVLGEPVTAGPPPVGPPAGASALGEAPSDGEAPGGTVGDAPRADDRTIELPAAGVRILAPVAAAAPVAYLVGRLLW